MAKMMKWAAVAAVAAAAVWGGWSYLKPEPQASYITEAVRRGDISRTVSA
ncbi:ABC transporter periplasmic protein [Neisseria meningitidis]|nr:ABC transporter periplasmic protein [Neisseria meningitidis]